MQHTQKVILIISLAWLIIGGIPSNLRAQVGQVEDYAWILDQLRRDVSRGNPRALRDLGSLFDKPIIGQKAKKIVSEHALFTDDELNVEKTTRTEFLSLYYDNNRKIKYSPLLRAFYLTPVEQQKVEYEIRRPKKLLDRDPAVQLRLFIRNFEILVSSGKDDEAYEEVNKIGKLGSIEAYRFLIDVLIHNKLFLSPLKNPARICRNICDILVEYPTEETLKTYLQLIDNQVITPQFAAPILAKLTNIWVVQDQQFRELTNRYNYWLDSLGNIESMRAHGYDVVFKFRRNYFQYPVDYYGKIISQSDDFPWIRYNALKDLVQTGNPRALFYLAGLGYHYRDLPHFRNEFEESFELLDEFTSIKVAVNGDKGMTSDHDYWYDKKALFNHLKYWSTHYSDFEWDPLKSRFVNKEETLELTENYERLYRRLNSTNDSVAMQAYLLLTEGEPIEVIALSKKYKELLRNYNRSLPSQKYEFLEKLVVMTQFCRRNKIRYKAPTRLASLMNEIGRTKNQKERYQLENQIISRLTLDEVTALEYWGVLNESQKEISFSVGRILDRFYTKNWTKVTSQEGQLRLYLKKSKLFSEIGVVGVCNDYLKKFEDITPGQRKHLEELLEIEGDKDIVHQINILLGNFKTVDKSSLIAFLETPNYWQKQELKLLPEPLMSDFENIYNALVINIEQETDKNIWKYLEIHRPLDFTPYLFRIMEEEKIYTEVLAVIEKIYDYKPKGGEDYWVRLFQNDGENYRDWSEQFYQRKLERLKQKPELTIKEVNEITLSPYFHSSLKSLTLTALKKVKPTKNIRRLKLQEPLDILEDLSYFNDFNFSHKELDDIPKLFNLKENLPTLVNWLFNKSAEFELDNKASFYNNIFRSNWFSDFVVNGKLDIVLAENMKATLEIYLNESENISEFEELATIRNIAYIENINRTLEEQLMASMQLEVDDQSKNKIQESILARVSYENIPLAVPYLGDLSVTQTYNFLNKDFGLPIFDLDNSTVRDKLVKNHQKFTEFEFYEYYLKKFGVDFLNDNGTLDFEKIYRILQYDIVSPFVGEGGNKRDYYTFGIIKLLELTFNTRLDFHEKLNENQTFYTFNASKRAKAWMEYLEDKKIVKSYYTNIPSFNMTVQD